MKYRSEIDGLRAVAVIPVILFHAGFELFSGGFVGVDIFFVISGYLITSILIADIANKRFSILSFYESRARRILPALFFVMLVCIPFSVYFFPPSELKDFFQSLVAVNFFSFYMFFWLEFNGGYFAPDSFDNPLLHTWSLAIEEQFYLLFPIFLISAWRFGKSKVFWMIVIFTAVSLALSEWGWRNKPQANFYFAPTRAWELLAGSIAAFVVQKHGVKNNNFLSLLGFVAIVFSIFFYNERTPFPSLYTLVPVLGATMLILYADKETIVAQLLSVKVLVGMGLISYSAYLWHQPMFVFTEAQMFRQLHFYESILIVIATFSLAYLSWRFIENPFRNKLFTKKQIFFMASLMFVLFSFLGTAYHFQIIPNKLIALEWGGVSRDLPKKFSGLIDNGKECSGRNPIDSCITSPGTQPQLVLLGDSHATVLVQAAGFLQDNGFNFSLVDMSKGGCPFFIGLNTYKYGKIRDGCKKTYQKERLNYLKSLAPSLVILHSRLPLYLHDSGFDNSIGGLEPERNNLVGINGDETLNERLDLYRKSLTMGIEELIKAGHEVFINTPIPPVGWNTLKRLTRYWTINKGNRIEIDEIRNFMSVPRPAVKERQELVSGLILELNNMFDELKVFDPKNLLCDESNCHSVSSSGDILYVDRDHLSFDGAVLIMRNFLERTDWFKFEEKDSAQLK